MVGTDFSRDFHTSNFVSMFARGDALSVDFSINWE